MEENRKGKTVSAEDDISDHKGHFSLFLDGKKMDLSHWSSFSSSVKLQYEASAAGFASVMIEASPLSCCLSIKASSAVI